MNRDAELDALETQLVLALRAVLSGRPANPLPRPTERRRREAVRQLSALLADPASGTGGRETADRAVRECASAGWRTGLLAARVLREVPALQRAEDRLRNRPEALRREMTGWLMLSRVLALSPDSPVRFPAASMAALQALGEVSRLKEEVAVVTAIDLCAEAPALENLVDAASALRLGAGPRPGRRPATGRARRDRAPVHAGRPLG